ncbi:MAG: chromate transporter [Clostridia bacterium]|nr:chromate transporter [Clostridia bacterium]
MIYLQLFWEYLKAGLFAVGGGMATIPFLYEISDRTGWFTHLQLADMLAISESTPGPVGVNMATYVGYTVRGIPGALTATFGLVLPSVIIILIVAKILKKIKGNRFVDAAFYGLRPASTAMIAAAGVTVMKIALLNLEQYRQSGLFADVFRWKAIVLALIVFVFSNLVKKTKKLHPIVFILFSALAGVIFKL